MFETLPLLPDFDPDRCVAMDQGREVSGATFLSQIVSVAARLPTEGVILNLCHDRYRFTVVLLASIVRGLRNLLLNANALEQRAVLEDVCEPIVCIGDDGCDVFSGLAVLSWESLSGASMPLSAASVPQIPVDQVVVQVYTSGSTGVPQAHTKTFGSIFASVSVEARRLWSVAGGACSVLGTVPIRHMYGLESTVFLPLFGKGVLAGPIPFYPADIVSALSALPVPRILVTTPFHLRALLSADPKVPTLAAVVSATAPLPLETAQGVENRWACPLVEIYGSTETGQLATRRSVVTDIWEVFDGVSLTENGDHVEVRGGHVDGVQVLQDYVQCLSATTFRLLDRKANLVNIAGKRTTLAVLNHALVSVAGVVDGVFYMPPDSNGAAISRLVAFFVSTTHNANDVMRALRKALDPAFLPRPLVQISALPRDLNGKVSSATLKALYAEYRTGGSQ